MSRLLTNVIRTSTFPVLMVKDPAVADYERVLIATDNSPSANRAARCALAIAPGAEFHLLHITHVPFKGLLGPEAQERQRGAEFLARIGANGCRGR